MEKKVKNFKELHEILNEFRGNSLWLFRGHRNKKWDLVPKAGRSPFESKGIKKVKPNGLATRVVRQSGIFTIHELLTSSIEDNI